MYVAIQTVIVCFFFFFSSRRRHTRLVSDWSSDVCSSDLISPQLSQIIAKCLAARAADRWQSAGELLAQLEGLKELGGATVSTQPVAAGKRARPPRAAENGREAGRGRGEDAGGRGGGRRRE